MHQNNYHCTMACWITSITTLFVIISSSSGASREVLPQDCGVNKPRGLASTKHAELGEFPWLARLKFIRNGEEEYSCDGILIHQQFVLTAGTCVADIRRGKLTSVILGEHDTEHNPDCQGTKCAPEILVEGIRIAIYHPDLARMKHNIALVKLKNPVTFNDYVSPICLTNESSLKNADSYTFSSWGRSGQDPIKFRATGQIVTTEDCQTFYKKFNVTIDENYICSKGDSSWEILSGDPLMYLSGGRWYAVGIASFGIPAYGRENNPTVFTNLIKYQDWILQTIEDTKLY